MLLYYHGQIEKHSFGGVFCVAGKLLWIVKRGEGMADRGRPLSFKTPKELEEKVKEYFLYADSNEKPYSIAKLALFLDCDRQTVYNYQEKDEFFDIIKKARERCIAALEERLLEEGKPGQIFIAKNYGYTDKQEIVSENRNINQDITNLSKEDIQKQIDEYLAKMNNNTTKVE